MKLGDLFSSTTQNLDMFNKKYLSSPRLCIADFWLKIFLLVELVIVLMPIYSINMSYVVI